LPSIQQLFQGGLKIKPMAVTGEVLLQVFTQVSERLQLKKTTDKTLHDDNTTKNT